MRKPQLKLLALSFLVGAGIALGFAQAQEEMSPEEEASALPWKKNPRPDPAKVKPPDTKTPEIIEMEKEVSESEKGMDRDPQSTKKSKKKALEKKSKKETKSKKHQPANASNTQVPNDNSKKNARRPTSSTGEYHTTARSCPVFQVEDPTSARLSMTGKNRKLWILPASPGWVRVRVRDGEGFMEAECLN